MSRRPSFVLFAAVLVTAFAAHAATPSGGRNRARCSTHLTNADVWKDDDVKASRDIRDPKTASKWKSLMNRRAMLMVLIGGAGGTVLIGGAMQIISPRARAVDESKKVALYKDRSAAAAKGTPTTSVATVSR